METKRTAEEAALKKLSYGMKTEGEMKEYLLKEGYDKHEISEALDYLRDMQYVNDENYVREFYTMCRAKGWSELRIINELENMSISEEDASIYIDDFKASDAYDGLKDDNAYALRVGIKMAGSQLQEGKMMDDKFYARLGRRLSGLGYRQRTIYYVIDKLRRGGKSLRTEAAEGALDMAEILDKLKAMQEKLENEALDQAEIIEREEKYREAELFKSVRND